MIRPLLHSVALATLMICCAVSTEYARASDPWRNACGYPTSICGADSAIAQRAALFEDRAHQLQEEVTLKTDPKVDLETAASCMPSNDRLRDRWRQIESKALALAHLAPQDLNQIIHQVRLNFGLAIRSVPQLSDPERAVLIEKVENIPIHLPSESTQPMIAMRSCGRDGTELQAFASGIDQTRPEVVLCPGLLLLENLTPELEGWVLEGLPSPIQSVIAHELAHHFSQSDRLAPGQASLRRCLVETLGVVEGVEQLKEVVADFWASEMINLAIGEPLEYRRVIRRSLILATLPVCILEQRMPPESNFSMPDSHYRALPRMTLSLSYHPRIQAKMGCHPFTAEHPTCDLGGSFPK